jgi:hypothetical protein
MLLAGLLLNPTLDHRAAIDTATEIFTNFSQNPNAARLLEFVTALIPLVERVNVGSGAQLPAVETALFDDLLNFDFNSFSGDNSLNWLMDLQ